MRITDLLSTEEWTDFEREFHAQTGLDTNVYDPDGFTFTGVKQWANSLCPAIKSRPDALQSICSVAHQNLAQIAMHTKAPVVEECDIGLLKICVPVFFNEEFIGAVGGCGHLLEESEVDTFLVHKMTDLQESEVEELASDVRVITRADAEAVAEEMQERIKEIVHRRSES